jgi:hypothetical protein
MQHTSQRFAILLALALALSCWATPYFQQSSTNNSNQQKQSDKNKNKNSDNTNNKDKNKKQQGEDDSPFGSTKVNMLRSSHTGDSASAGFNDLTPNGEVEAKKLKEPATAGDLNKAVQVSLITVKAASLRKFIQDGKLKTASAKTETATRKKG